MVTTRPSRICLYIDFIAARYMTKSALDTMLQKVRGADLIFTGGVSTIPRQAMLCRERWNLRIRYNIRPRCNFRGYIL